MMNRRFFAAALAGTAAGATAMHGQGRGWNPPVNATVPATEDETRWLKFMREEEKMARDVYNALFAKWSLRVFENIAASEQRHFDSVGTLLTRYQIADPAAATAAGVFADERLQALYNELMAKGTASVRDALEAGLAIEKTDIADLEDAMKATAKTDIKRVYTNLLDGSLNHQDAFEAMLEVYAQ